MVRKGAIPFPRRKSGPFHPYYSRQETTKHSTFLCTAKTSDRGRCVPELTLFGAAVDAIPEHSIRRAIEGQQCLYLSVNPPFLLHGDVMARFSASESKHP